MPPVPVEAIIITGYASLDTALAAMQLDVYDYIVKPAKDVFMIQRRIRQAFEKQAMARENRRLLKHLKEKNEELNRMVDELRNVQAELIQSEKLAGIGTLAAGIAHEISSPLFGVMGLAEAIQTRTIKSWCADMQTISSSTAGPSRTS